ncbi:MAG: M28 family peptidase, partial [Gemmatimonadetes bacterium]|nr:M28 family peptidase [Gemmatimonadota bacterium]
MRSACVRAASSVAFPAGTALLLAFAACAAPAPGPGASAGSTDALTEATQAEIQVAAMNQELDSLVQHERLSGSPGEFAAVEYLRRTLEAEGIQVRVDTFMAYISDPVSASVEVPAAGFAPQAITVSGAGTVRNLEAQLVDVGTLEDLPPLLMAGGERLILDADGPAGSVDHPAYPDLKGKIALVTGAPRPEPAIQLSLMGAAGAVFVHPEELLNDLTITSVWGGPSLLNYHRIPTLPVAEVKRSDGDRLRELLGRGRVQLRMSTETKTGWKELRLLVATIPGPTPDAPYVLAGGHLDSWYHGGTDNAGANVAMLETTRALFRHRSELRRGLVMAWWPGHSNGRYAGSTWFVDQKFDALRKHALAYVNYEGMGQILAKRFGAATTASLNALARDVVLKETGDSIRPRPPGRSSDESFNGVGLPLLEISHSRLDEDGGYWWWHTPDDTRDKVDAEVLKVDTDIYAAVLARLLAEPAYPVSLTAVVERLGTLLGERQQTAGTHLDLSEAMARQARLLETVKQVEAAAATKPGPDTDLAVVAILRPLHRVL